MGDRLLRAALAAGFALLAGFSTAQDKPQEKRNAGQPQAPNQTMTTEQRAEATRNFLGLDAEPDRAAAVRGAPLFARNCAVCHGTKARGALGPSLITSDKVLSDNHGEQLAPYIKAGRPDKGMPAFANLREGSLKDIAEYLHLQVEEVANRGSYHVLNILVGKPSKGQAYVAARCTPCHTADTFAHFAARFASPEQLQRGWIWPGIQKNNALAATAVVKTADGAAISGRVTQVSDFRIVLVDSSGNTHAIDLTPGVEVEVRDPLAPHQQMISTLKNSDMHDVTAYLETLK